MRKRDFVRLERESELKSNSPSELLDYYDSVDALRFKSKRFESKADDLLNELKRGRE